jgi:transaldolase
MSLAMVRLIFYLIVALVLVGVGAYGGWSYQKAIGDAAVEKLQQAAAQKDAQIAQLNDARDRLALRRADEISSLSQGYEQEKNDALKSKDSTIASLQSGKLQLLVSLSIAKHTIAVMQPSADSQGAPAQAASPDTGTASPAVAERFFSREWESNERARLLNECEQTLIDERS